MQSNNQSPKLQPFIENVVNISSDKAKVSSIDYNQDGSIEQKKFHSNFDESHKQHASETSPTFGASQGNGTKIICEEVVLQDTIEELHQATAPAKADNLHSEVKALLISETIVQPFCSSTNDLTQQASIDNKMDAQQIQTPYFIQKTKKRIVAKDDMAHFSNEVEQRKKNRNQNLKNIQEGNILSSPTRQNVFHIERSQKKGSKPKRKMSEDQRLLFPDTLGSKLFGEEDNEFDLAQSLLTLQINTSNLNKQLSNVKKSFGQSPFIKQKNNQPSYLKGGQQYDLAKGRDVMARKMSNLAYASIYDDASDNMDQDKDEENQDSFHSSQKSVSLEDSGLDNLGVVKLNSKISTNGLNGNIQNAIINAEQGEISREEPPVNQPEEYESLLWGQSIWSTDIPKESKKQFIENFQQIVTGTESNTNAPEKKDENTTNDFDDLQNSINRQTSNQELIAPGLGMNQYTTDQTHHNMMFNDATQQPYNIDQLQQQPVLSQNYAINQSNQYQMQQTQEMKAEYYNAAADPYHDYAQQQFQNTTSTKINATQDTSYGTGYQDMKNTSGTQQQFTSGVSVHSGGQAVFPGHGSSNVEYINPDYPDNNSSNYTHHPYSQYGQHSQFDNNQAMYQQQQDGNQNTFQNQNRAHIYINRQINKYMMNPIYKSKQTVTSLHMHRYASIPWRGGQNQNMNAQFQQMQQLQNQMQMISPPGLNPNLKEPGNDHQETTGMIDHFNNYLNAQDQSHQQQQQNMAQMEQHQQHMFYQSQPASLSQHPQSTSSFQESLGLQQPQGTSDIISKEFNPVNAKPFYPKNQGELKQQISESVNILAAGNPRANNFNGGRQKAAPAIHVPIPIPIMSRGKGNMLNQGNQRKQKPQGGDPDNQNNNGGKQMQNDRSIFMNNFYQDEILQKKDELDKRLKETTQNLESKLINAEKINNEDDNDDEEEDELTFEVQSNADPSEISMERSDRNNSVLNKSMNLKELKQQVAVNNQIFFKNIRPQVRKNSGDNNESLTTQKENKLKNYEEKIKRKNDRAAIFKKLQEQLKEFKSEMFTSSDQNIGAVSSSFSPKRSDHFQQKVKNETSIDLKNVAATNQRLTPFKQDAKQYMDKVLNLMNMINEVDGLSNLADLKNKLEKQKLMFNRVKDERDECINQIQKIQDINYHNEQAFKQKQISFQSQLSESQTLSQTLNQNLVSLREQSDHQIYELSQQLNKMSQENHDLIIQNTQQQESYKIQLQTLQNQNDQLTQANFNLHSQVSGFNGQVEQLNKNNYQVQANLNQQLIKNQQLSQNIENMEIAMTQKIEEIQQSSKKNKKGSRSPSSQEGSSGGQDIDDEDEVPLDEQLENANNQIRNLQDYIKKRGFENNSRDVQQERYNQLLHQKQLMEAEKDKIINNLKNYIRNKDFHGNIMGISMINESTITAQSLVDEEEDRNDNIDFVKSIMNNYCCEKCDQKDKIISNMEMSIQEMSIKAAKTSIHTQTDEPLQSSNSKINNSQNSISESSGNTLKASHKLLLNNFVRKIKEYLDNVEEQEEENIIKLKNSLFELSKKQRITLFDEEEEPDSSLITPELIQNILQMSLGMITELITSDLNETNQTMQISPPETQVIEKVVTQFQTVDFGVNMQQLKEMQNTARTERKACHHIIVEIEKLMYEMDSKMNSNDGEASKIFAKILETYLLLPHRLKPIFDHCKKIETVLVKALKSQEEVLKAASPNES